MYTKTKYILAIDSFKGCMTSEETEETVAEALELYGNNCDTECVTVSDGGDGMLKTFAGVMNAETVTTAVHDPMMRRIEAEYGIAADGTAIIETAQACGLTLIKEEERNPMRATSYGVGELIASAFKRGCRKFIVGLGGSATSDAGIGMMMAITDKLAPRGGHFDDIATELRDGCRFTLASDVTNPLYGPDGAAAVFGPQKGATPDMIKMLDSRAMRFAEISARHFGYDLSDRPGAGAAGGLGYAFMQYLGAEMKAGAELMLSLADFDSRLTEGCCVITGEGHADRQTLMGKMPYHVMKRARAKGLPTWLIAGKVDDRQALLDAGFTRVAAVTPDDADITEAMKKDNARNNIRNAIRLLLEEASTEKQVIYSRNNMTRISIIYKGLNQALTDMP